MAVMFANLSWWSWSGKNPEPSSESDNSDWSIGWMEPHAPGFQTNDGMDSSFAVLVPCYGHSSKDQFSGAIVDFTAVYSAESGISGTVAIFS
ncbi:hypothetical protein FRX31_003812 [Thalictrum thalictroides]|uniref:Uncharacterized protein n=1 Tax=Thalictrum thalictroides TaxID=46969 RepID=A0A7J6XCF6_THATH|nr:hypothetical protein FRX31_003812 [Thalictrum thalictroides]